MKRTLRIVPRALVAALVTCGVALAAWVTITAVEGEGSKKLGSSVATVIPVEREAASS
jgi:hypothetical protein